MKKNNGSNPPCVLVVDDEESIRRVVQQTLNKTGYESFESDCAEKALRILDKTNIDVVITDIKMNGLSGIELLKLVKEKFKSDVMIMTGFAEDFTYEEIIDAGASDFIHKPFSAKELIVRLKRVLRERDLHRKIIKSQKELKAYHRELIKTLVSIIEEKDMFMKGHAERVASNCVHFIRNLDIPQIPLEKIYFAGLLHDIGKVYLPKDAFKKTEKLSKDHLNMVHQHPIMADKILSNNDLLKDIAPVIRHHHEAFDGTGYPDNLCGEEIPLMARILNIVDCYDNLTSDSPYGPALSNKEALEELVKNSGKFFDRNLVNDFLKHMEEPADSSVEEANTADSSEINGGNESQNIRNMLMEIIKSYKTGEIALPVLPNIVQEIQDVINSDNSTVDDLARVIEKDGAISIRLITIANSPIYRGTEKFTTVKEAVPRLGAKEIQNIVTAIVARNLYKSKNTQFKLLMEKLWTHSLASAYAAREIAGKLRLGNEDQFFFMGLLHDIGKLPLLKSLSETFSNNNIPDISDIVSNIQAIHSGFGGFILNRWGYGNEFVDIAVNHENPDFCETTEKSIMVISLGNLMAHKTGYRLSDDVIEFPEAELMKRLDISSENFIMTQEKLEKIMQESAGIF